GFVPDGAARALSNGLKEVVGVVFRRGDETPFPDEDESFLFIDVIYRGIDLAARRQGFDVLMGSVGFNDGNVEARVAAVGGKADGLILHDRMIPATSITRLASLVPVVTLAGTPVAGAMNVRCDNDEGMRRLVRHLVLDHGYKELGYLSGRIDSPDNHARAKAIEAEATANGAQVEIGHDWQGDYSAAGGARVISGLLDSGRKLPRAIVCANDQTALGAMHALGRRGLRVPEADAITVSFLLPRVVPGNPVAGAVARASQSGNCNEQCVRAIELQLGYNVHTSLWDQYTQYLGNLAHGDLGHSWSENAPVASLIVS